MKVDIDSRKATKNYYKMISTGNPILDEYIENSQV